MRGAAAFAWSMLVGCSAFGPPNLTDAESARADELTGTIQIRKNEPPSTCKEVAFLEARQLRPSHEELYRRLRLAAHARGANYVRLDFVGKQGGLTAMSGAGFSCPAEPSAQ